MGVEQTREIPSDDPLRASPRPSSSMPFSEETLRRIWEDMDLEDFDLSENFIKIFRQLPGE